MSDTKEMLARARRRIAPPDGVMESLIRRRDRVIRNRRITAAVLAIVVALVTFGSLLRTFRRAEQPATEPRSRGIFAGTGGWIAYGDADGIWATDPNRPGDRPVAIRLTDRPGEPIAWSRDGSQLLIERNDSALTVLSADGSETILFDMGDRHFITGGSFSPDGSEVVYADVPWGGRGVIYVVDASGGSPRPVLRAGRRSYPALGHVARSKLYDPVFSPDGTQIAYLDGLESGSHSLRVMNVRGGGSRVVVPDRGVLRGDVGYTGGIDWSPDGTHLAFDLQGGPAPGIYVVGVDGTGLTLAVPGGLDPHWSPDGARISYQRGSQGTPGPLQVAAADGTHIVDLGSGLAGPWNPTDPDAPGAQRITEDGGARHALITWFALVLTLLAAAAGVIRRRRRAEARNPA